MSELYIFSQEDKFITILTKEEGLVDTWFKDYENSVEDEPFTFNVKSNSPLLKYVVEENQVAFYDRDNDLRLVRIKELYELSNEEGNIITAKCEPSFLELYDHLIEDRRFTDKTAQHALDAALNGTRYVGEVTVDLGLASDNFYWIDSIEAVWKILETWGGSLKDTITLNQDNEIIERKLWIVQRLGTDNGLIVEPNYNAEEISRNTLSYPKTALWAQGASLDIEDDEGNLTGGHTRYITFEDVEWKVSNGDPVDKPKGQKWVGDPEALQEYGYLHNGKRQHRFGHFSNQDYETAEELLWATWQELQERKLKEIMHEATIYESDKIVSLGDTVTILNRKYNKPIELQSQITGLEYDLLEKEEVTIVVGKHVNMNEDPLEKEIDDLKEEVKKPRPTKPIDNDSFPDIKPSTPSKVTATGSVKTIQLHWDYPGKVYIKHYEVYGSQVKDFVPDSQQLLWRGDVSAFTHNVDTDQTWYYRVRAVNTHGTPSDYSGQVSASSVRVISDDILFGKDIAEELRELSKVADLLADNTVSWDKISDAAKETINTEIKMYTDAEIKQTKEELLKDINAKVDTESLKDYISEVESVLDEHENKFIYYDRDINELTGQMTTTIENYERIDGKVEAHTAELTEQASKISAKLDSATYTKEKEGIVKDIEYNKAEIEATSKELSSKISRDEFDSLEIGGRNLLKGTSDKFKTVKKEGWFDFVSDNANINIPIKEGETYTFRAYLKSDKDNTANFMVMARLMLAEGQTTGRLEFNGNELKPSEEGYSTITFTVPKGFKYLRPFTVRAKTKDAGTQSVDYKEDKLEKGTKATDWTPAPEDIEQRFSHAETDIKQNAERILAKAEKDYVDTLTDSISKDVAQLDIKYNEITTTVNNIEIGGRNLIKDSENIPKHFGNGYSGANAEYTKVDMTDEWGFENAYEVKTTGGTNTSGLRILSQHDGMVMNQRYVYSVYIKNIGTDNIKINTNGLGASQQVTVKPSESIRYTSEGERRENYDWFQILIIADGIDKNVHAILGREQLERGNKATDWTPDPEDADARMTKSESTIQQLSKEIKLKVNVDDLVSEINLSKEGIRLKGSLIEIDGLTLIRDAVIGTAALKNASISRAKLKTAVIGTAQLDDAVITNAKIAKLAVDNSHIANLSAVKLTAGTIDGSKVKIRGGSSTDYTLIDGSLIESRGKFVRTWRGVKTNYDVKLKLENGYFRARNDSLDRSLYFSEFGLSTYMDGTGDYVEPGGGSSGSLIFWDTSYSPTGSGNRGITLNSYGGTVAMVSDKSRALVQAEASIRLESRQQPIFIRPKMDKQTTDMSFAFTTSDSTQDGYLTYGSLDNAFTGLRFYRGGTPQVAVVDENYERGGNTKFDVGYVATNRVTKRDGSYDVYWNGTSGGSTSTSVSSDTLRASGIRTLSGDRDMFLANDGYVRSTGYNGYNEGKGISYRGFAGNEFVNLSSEKYKENIEKYTDSALAKINETVIYNYTMKNAKEPKTKVGLIVERETPEEVISDGGQAVDQYTMTSLSWRAIQELSKQDDFILDEINWLKLENQQMKHEIKELREMVT